MSTVGGKMIPLATRITSDTVGAGRFDPKQHCGDSWTNSLYHVVHKLLPLTGERFEIEEDCVRQTTVTLWMTS